MTQYKKTMLKALFHTFKPMPTFLLGACFVYAHTGFSARLVTNQGNLYGLTPASSAVFGVASPPPLDKATLSLTPNKMLTLTLAQPGKKSLVFKGERKVSAYMANAICQKCSATKKKSLGNRLNYSTFLKARPHLKRNSKKALNDYLAFLKLELKKNTNQTAIAYPITDAATLASRQQAEYYALSLTGASATQKDLSAIEGFESKELAAYYIGQSDERISTEKLSATVVNNWCGNTCTPDVAVAASVALESAISASSSTLQAEQLSAVMDGHWASLELSDATNLRAVVEKAVGLASEETYAVGIDTLRASVAVETLKHATVVAALSAETLTAIATYTEVAATNRIPPPLICEIVQV